MNRRFFLRGLIAAPAVIAAAHIMPVRSIERLLIPWIWGDGYHDDAEGLQAFIEGRPFRPMSPVSIERRGGIDWIYSSKFRTTKTLFFHHDSPVGFSECEFNTTGDPCIHVDMSSHIK